MELLDYLGLVIIFLAIFGIAYYSGKYQRKKEGSFLQIVEEEAAKTTDITTSRATTYLSKGACDSLIVHHIFRDDEQKESMNFFVTIAELNHNVCFIFCFHFPIEEFRNFLPDAGFIEDGYGFRFERRSLPKEGIVHLFNKIREKSSERYVKGETLLT